MSKELGWIKVYREIQHHWIWQNKPFDKRSAWLDLLLIVNHQENKLSLGNTLVTVKRGSTITSIRKLSDRWGWSNTKVTSFLKLLKSEKMLSFISDTKKTVITIENYSLYQDNPNTKTTEKRHVNDKKTTLKHTNKNVRMKEGKNNDNSIGCFTAPTIEEVKAYCQERKNRVDPETWFDFYKSKGWMVGKNKMKDWQACVRTWEKNQKTETREWSKDGRYKGFPQRDYNEEDIEDLYWNPPKEEKFKNER